MNSEPLANLERIGLLDPVPFSEALMQKMLHVAQSRLEDAMRQDNSMGELVTDSLLKECLEQAGALLTLANKKLSNQ
jgi:hypothetical protein